MFTVLPMLQEPSFHIAIPGRKLLEALISVYKYLKHGRSQTLFSCMQQNNKGQGAQTGTQEFHTNIRTFLGDRALERLPGKVVKSPSLDIIRLICMLSSVTGCREQL